MKTKTNTTLLLLPFLLLLTSFISDAARVDNIGPSNVIDRCRRRGVLWSKNRQRLASCLIGFAGKMRSNRGPGVTQYVVTDDSDNAVRPRPGTLRYGTSMVGKVWITFARDMVIKLERPLLIGSYTTIDGRGVDVQIAWGAGFMLNKVHDVIIHGLQFHHNRVTSAGPVIGPGGKVTTMWGSDGDAIRLVTSSKIWIDHNTLYAGEDGLLDVTRGSTDVTISNNWFHDHDKVMLLGHDDSFIEDRNMRVTVVFNRFGPNCNQRMPRIRHGYAHVANNLYEGWKLYAIGGSMNPMVRSEANFFIAPPHANKAVTWRLNGENWNWKSVNDIFVNGAFFGKTVNKGLEPRYNPKQFFVVDPANSVKSLTKSAGALRCSQSQC